MALDPLITSEQLELRLTPPVYVRVFNDFNTGQVNRPAELQLREDASSKVRGALANTYPVDDLIAENEVYATELRRITLDVAHALCAQRNPTVILLDGFALMEQAEKELEKIREGITTLGSDTPTDGGSGSGSTTTSTPTRVVTLTSGRVLCNGRPQRNSDDWGDFG